MSENSNRTEEAVPNTEKKTAISKKSIVPMLLIVVLAVAIIAVVMLVIYPNNDGSGKMKNSVTSVSGSTNFMPVSDAAGGSDEANAAFLEIAQTAVTEYEDNYGGISEDAFVVVEGADESACFNVIDGVLTPAKTYPDVINDDNMWIKVDGYVEDYYWYVCEEDKLYTQAYDDVADTHEAMSNAAKTIADGTLYLWSNDDTEIMFNFNDGIMSVVPPNSVKTAKKNHKKVNLADIQDANKNVVVYEVDAE